MAHEEEGTEVSLGKIEVIKTLSEAGFRRWIVKRGNEMIYERDAAAYERGYCGV